MFMPIRIDMIFSTANVQTCLHGYQHWQKLLKWQQKISEINIYLFELDIISIHDIQNSPIISFSSINWCFFTCFPSISCQRYKRYIYQYTVVWYARDYKITNMFNKWRLHVIFSYRIKALTLNTLNLWKFQCMYMIIFNLISETSYIIKLKKQKVSVF